MNGVIQSSIDATRPIGLVILCNKQTMTELAIRVHYADNDETIVVLPMDKGAALMVCVNLLETARKLKDTVIAAPTSKIIL